MITYFQSMDKKDNNKKQHNRYNKNTAEKIKNMASEVANNTTGIISPSEAKNILNKLGEASKKIALSGTDVLSNFSGEIKEGLK